MSRRTNDTIITFTEPMTPEAIMLTTKKLK